MRGSRGGGRVGCLSLGLGACPWVVVVVPLGFAMSSFVPASVVVGSVVRPASSFSVVASGVVVGLSWDAVRSAVVVELSGGARLACLARALGGAGSSDASALVAALRAARASGVVVELVGAPGARGSVLAGYFCGVRASELSLAPSSLGALLRARLDAPVVSVKRRVSAIEYAAWLQARAEERAREVEAAWASLGL